MKINLPIKNLFLAMRPKQFTKNFLVFLAPLFSFNLEAEIWLNAFFSLIFFCLISGSMYLINDSFDYNNDRLHPIKKYRMIASGKVSIHLALFAAFIIISSVLINPPFIIIWLFVNFFFKSNTLSYFNGGIVKFFFVFLEKDMWSRQTSK